MLRLPLRFARVGAALAVMLAACGGGSGGDDASGTSATPGPCADGESLVDGACEPSLPPAPCAAGTRAALGSATCVPVGPSSCGPGFAPHASGWGCVPVLPARACAGPTRDALGQTSCVPVGDCNAPLPAAAITVDASLAAEDATHKKTIAAAIAAATTGATIAIAAGTYAESVTIDKPLTIAGRCAERVVVAAPSNASAFTVHAASLALSGVTVRGGVAAVDVAGQTFAGKDLVLEANLSAGLSVFARGKATLERSVVRGTRSLGVVNNGVFADESSAVTVTECAIEGAEDSGIGATGAATIALARSVVRDTVARPDGIGGSGARAYEGAGLTIEDSAIVGSRGTALLVGKSMVVKAHASARVARSSFTSSTLDTRENLAVAVSVSDGTSFTAEDATFADNPVATLFVDGAGTAATLQRCAIVDTIATGGVTGSGIGVVARGEAALELDASVVQGSTGLAVLVGDVGTKVTMRGSLVVDTMVQTRGRNIPAGDGFGSALVVVRGGALKVETSTVQGSRGAAVMAADDGSKLRFSQTLIRGTTADQLKNAGHGILAQVGSRIDLDRCMVVENEAIGVAYSRATGFVSGTLVRRNAVGIQVQKGSSLVQGDALPASLPPLTVFVTADTRFLGNGSEVGAGEVPLPAVLDPTQP